MTATDSPTVMLEVSKRTAPLAARALRRASQVPLQVYGKGQQNINVAADRKLLTNLLRQHGTTTLIDIVLEQEKPFKALLREPQLHPVTRELLHADLYRVDLSKKITAKIPLTFSGRSTVIEDEGGTLIESKTEVEVECLPQDLPHELAVDIATLTTFDDVLHVSDIPIPAGVDILDEPDEVIASVAEPRSEEELAALDEAPEADVDSVEVEQKGKEEGEESESSEAGEAGEAAGSANEQQ